MNTTIYQIAAGARAGQWTYRIGDAESAIYFPTEYAAYRSASRLKLGRTRELDGTGRNRKLKIKPAKDKDGRKVFRMSLDGTQDRREFRHPQLATQAAAAAAFLTRGKLGVPLSAVIDDDKIVKRFERLGAATYGQLIAKLNCDAITGKDVIKICGGIEQGRAVFNQMRMRYVELQRSGLPITKAVE